MRRALRAALAGLALSALAGAAAAGPAWVQPHHRLDTRQAGHEQDVALTLDACGGAYDAALIRTLVRLRVPATLFVTQRWLRRNPAALAELRAHASLFELQNHGANHVPAVVGARVYGMPGLPGQAAVRQEVQGGADAVAQASGQRPAWYRGAGAAYDAQSLRTIAALGLGVAGFSLNADDGATLGARAVAARLARAQPGDVVIAHMNHPASGTAQGIAAALPQLQQRGLRFVTLGQSAGLVPAP